MSFIYRRVIIIAKANLVRKDSIEHFLPIFISLHKYKTPIHFEPCSLHASHMDYLPATSRYVKQ